MNRLFGNDVVTHYPREADPSSLRHRYDGQRRNARGSVIPFQRIVSLVDGLKRDVRAWYEAETGAVFDTYTLGDTITTVRRKFWCDPRFAEALSLLGLPPDSAEQLLLPWWNEVAATELEHTLGTDGPLVTLGSRHSFETQLVRAGFELPIRSVSVGGIIETNDGYIVIGLRGGAAFPNTYHINAGALGLVPELISGDQTIFSFYKKHELLPEFGVKESNIHSANLLCRIVDYSIENGPTYVFLIRLNLSFDELKALYETNLNVDKGEHTRLIKMPKDPESVMVFVGLYYRGLVENKPDRSDDQRYLLHPGALALTAYAHVPPAVLADLYQPGSW